MRRFWIVISFMAIISTLGLYLYRYSSMARTDDNRHARWESSEAWRLSSLASKPSTDITNVDVERMVGEGWVPDDDMVIVRGNLPSDLKISSITNLRGVTLASRTVSTRDISSVSNCLTLQYVCFLECDFDNNCDWSKLMPSSIVHLSFWNCRMSRDTMIAIVKRLPRGLVVLELGDLPFSDSDINMLQLYRKLQHVGLVGNTTLTDIGFKELCEIPSLVVVNVSEYSRNISRSAKNEVLNGNQLIFLSES